MYMSEYTNDEGGYMKEIRTKDNNEGWVQNQLNMKHNT